jgi:hypothetical protein
MERQARAFTYVHGTTFTTEPLEAYARAVGPLPAGRRSGDLPGQRRLRGDRELPQAGAVLPPGPPRAGPDRRDRAVGELPRQLDGRAGSLRPRAAAPALRAVARPLPATSAPRIHIGRERPPPTPWATWIALVAELEAAIAEAGPGRVAAFVAEPIVGATLGAVVAAGRLLAGHRGGLPAPRHPARRRRSDDRLRADGALVRDGPLGRPAGRDGRGQGRRRRLLPARPGRRERQRLRDDHRGRRLRPRVHVQPLPGGRGGGRRSAADPGDGEPRRGQRRRRASGCWRC